MIRKHLTTTLLAVSLSACGDRTGEEGGSRDKQSFFEHAVERTLSLFKSGPDREDTQQAEKRTAKIAQKSGKPLPRQKHLPQMMANNQSVSQSDDRMIDIEELEQYRQDYAEAVDGEGKAEALIALVQADEQNAVALLQEAYESPEPLLRKEAVLQMQDFIEKEEVVDMLLKALDDSDPDVVMEAVEGLSGLENKRVLDGLKKVAQSHPDELVREVAQDYVDQADVGDQ